MSLVRFLLGGSKVRYGVFNGSNGTVIDKTKDILSAAGLGNDIDEKDPKNLAPLFEKRDIVFDILRRALKSSSDLEKSIPVSSVKLLAPIEPHRNFMCVGKNYLDHVAEIAKVRGDSSAPTTVADLPKHVMFFTKAPQCVVHPGDKIQSHVGLTKWLDFEAELAVVIGKGGKNISAENALDHVFGYTIANDVTARDIQKAHGQFFKGKTLDATCPLGPAIVSSKDVDASNLSIKLWLNGSLMQNSNTNKMIFKIPEIIHQLSKGFTLMPGDVILTGTPDGVGYARKPPVCLKNGDKIDIEIESLGRLSNTVE